MSKKGSDECRYVVFASFSELPAGEWDKLLACSDSNSVFLTLGWLSSWEQSYGKNAELIIVLAYGAGDLIAAAAFENKSGELIFAGLGPSDYSDFIFRNDLEESFITRVLSQLLTEASRVAIKFRNFKLGRIQENSPSFKALNHPECCFFTTVSRTGVAPQMSMDTVEQALRKKSLVRHERKLKKQGNLECRTYSKSEDIHPLLDAFFSQHIARWDDTPYPSLFLQTEAREFYKELVINLGDTGCLRFTVLFLDETLLAAHFGFVHSGRYTWYKPTFDVNYAKMSPGEVMLKHLLEFSRDEPVDIFDFTIGNEAFKLRFATKVPAVCHVHITNSRLRASIVAIRQKVKELHTAWVK